MRQRGKKRKRDFDEVEGDRDEVSFLSCKYLLEDTMMNFRPDIITHNRKIAMVLRAEWKMMGMVIVDQQMEEKALVQIQI